MRERWKDIVGYEGLYQVSNLGQIRSLDRVVPHKRNGTITLKGQILSPYLHVRYGVLIELGVNLCKGGRGTTKTVHRIVLEAWVGPCPDGLEGCHNDGNAANNALSNLRWDTHANNELDKRKHGTHRGRPVRRSDGVDFINMHVAAEETGCREQNIWRACNNKRKHAGGYGWTYL